MSTIARFHGILKQKLVHTPETFTGYLSVEDILGACREEHHAWRERFWTPLETVWTFLVQVLSPKCSCRKAVAKVLAHRVAQGQSATVSPDASAYSQARHRLPEGVICRCFRHVGRALQAQADGAALWGGRRGWLVDGSTCSMPDTPENQAAFGQPRAQKPGCGFPVARLVGLFCWATGAMVDLAIGPLRRGEIHLWRTLWETLKAMDVVLADRYYCTYEDMAKLIARGCDFVFRLHGARSRTVDFRKGKRLGKNDRLVTFVRPQRRPERVPECEWRSWPPTLTVRLIRVAVAIPGYRSRTILITTSLLDPQAFPLQKIADLYRDRWLVELRLRDIKTTLGMDILRGKSPDMVRKEIYMHLLAYNLIRILMWQAARTHQTALRRLSFAGTVQRLNALAPYLRMVAEADQTETLYHWLLLWIAHDPVPDRPHRIEPRAVKRRPKEYDLLNKPRSVMRRELKR